MNNNSSVMRAFSTVILRVHANTYKFRLLRFRFNCLSKIAIHLYRELSAFLIRKMTSSNPIYGFAPPCPTIFSSIKYISLTSVSLWPRLLCLTFLFLGAFGIQISFYIRNQRSAKTLFPSDFLKPLYQFGPSSSTLSRATLRLFLMKFLSYCSCYAKIPYSECFCLLELQCFCGIIIGIECTW